MREAVITSGGETRSDRMRAASKERRSLQKQELRSLILATAAELLLEQGYDHFSLRQVAERIGYSATTIYLYFENKDALLFEVMSDGWQRFSDEFLAAAESSDAPLERLHAMASVYVSFGLNNPAVYDLMFVQRSDFLMHNNLYSEGKP